MSNESVRQTTYLITVQENAQKESKQQESMKRLTIDISESLHKVVKARCAMRGITIADEVRDFLSKKYGN